MQPGPHLEWPLLVVFPQISQTLILDQTIVRIKAECDPPLDVGFPVCLLSSTLVTCSHTVLHP